MKNIQVKLIQDKRGLTKASEIVKAVQTKLAKPWLSNEIKINYKSQAVLSKHLLKAFGESSLDLSTGARQGCYGSSTGEIFPGFTLWLSPALLIERAVEPKSKYNDKECEWVNLHALIEENGGELFEAITDAEKFEEFCEEVGLEVKRDNTYNWSGNSEVVYMFDADFAVIEGKDSTAFLSIKYHCGGDPRGNYTDKVVYKFNSIDDLYSALMPYPQLIEEK